MKVPHVPNPLSTSVTRKRERLKAVAAVNGCSYPGEAGKYPRNGLMHR
jgi:hypothetical protein